MHIFGFSKIDKQNRINLTDFFEPGNMPKEVVFTAAETVKNWIICFTVTDAADLPELSPRMKVDKKGRAIIPKWLRATLATYGEGALFLYDEKTKRKLIMPQEEEEEEEEEEEP